MSRRTARRGVGGARSADEPQSFYATFTGKLQTPVNSKSTTRGPDNVRGQARSGLDYHSNRRRIFAGSPGFGCNPGETMRPDSRFNSTMRVSDPLLPERFPIFHISNRRHLIQSTSTLGELSWECQGGSESGSVI